MFTKTTEKMKINGLKNATNYLLCAYAIVQSEKVQGNCRVCEKSE
jgi:hypothetical protein